jgi:hypothetical protein
MTSFAKTRSPRRAAARVAALLAVVAVSISASIAPAAQAAEPWGFEQVTPVNKGAGSVHPGQTFQTTPDGNGLLLSATSSFEGVPAESVPLYTRYFASRGANGWSNRAMDPATNHTPPASVATVMSLVSASSNVSHVMVASTLALTPGATPDGGNLYLRNTATGAYTLVATHEDIWFTRQFFANLGNFNAKYVANDGRSALFSSVVPLVPGAPDGRLDNLQSFALYSWTAEDGVRVVSVLPDSEGGGMTTAATGVGGQMEYGIRNALPDSDGLDYVYFSRREGFGGNGPAYVRSGGETKAVSVSRIPEASSDPVAANVLATGRGGRFMLFMTTESGLATPLTSDTPTDLPALHFLYRYDAVNDSLDYIGAMPSNPKPALQMSQDGRTVAFLSRFELAPGAPAYDPQNPTYEENVYVWRDGVLRFVAQSGSDSDVATGSYLRILSSNGRYLAFTDNSTGPLSAADIAGADVGSPSSSADCLRDGPTVCPQVFIFDADTDELECASCRTDGLAPQSMGGDPGAPGASGVYMDHRQVQTVADDGTAFFTTAEDLVASDVNGLSDVYAYRDGEHRLVSRAAQGMKARFLDATPDGETVFFATNDPIAATDNDKAIDVYMTREGAGFPYTPPIFVPPCTGSDCRNPFAPVAELPLAGSVTFSRRGNAGPTPVRLSIAGRKSIAGTAGRLRVKVPGRGRVTVSGAGVKTVKRRVSRAGTYTVRVALTAKARKALKRSRSKSARKRVRVTFTPAQGSASKRTLSLTYKSKPANKKKGR